MPLFTFQTRRPLPETAQEMQARIKYLFTIRDELDKELEMLMGRRDTFEAARPWHCVRCGYEWRSRLPHRPKLCPKCKAKKFDTPPLYTYEERMARKAANGKLPLAPLAHSVITRQVYVESSVPRVSVENDSIQNVMLTPPPEPGTIYPVPMSLRERLAQMSKRESVAGADTSASNATVDGESPLPLQRAVARPATLGDTTAYSMERTYLGTADTSPVSNGHDAVPTEEPIIESAVATEEELMEAINGDTPTE